MKREQIHNLISYTLIASIFITGEGIDLGVFRFYWYYPVYLLFVILGLLSFRRMEWKPLAVMGGILIYALVTYKSDLPLVIKQFINISFSGLVFYFFIYHERKDLVALFEKYVKAAKVIAVLGIIQVFLFLTGLGGLFLAVFPWLKGYDVSDRLQSLSQEPSYIAFTFAPVVFVALHNLYCRTRYFMSTRWSLVFVLTYLLTQSALALTGLILMIILIYCKNLTYRKLQFSLVAIVGVSIICVTSYFKLPGIKIRVDDTLSALSSDFFESDKYLTVNPSTYAVVSNYLVTMRGFREHPILGHGFGTYEVVYDKYIPAKVTLVDRNYMLLNRQDGASMGLRLLTETGLIGLIVFLLFTLSYKVRSHNYFSQEMEVMWILNTGIFVLIALALLRNGNYTVHGKLLFFLMYYFSYKQVRTSLKSQLTFMGESPKQL